MYCDFEANQQKNNEIKFRKCCGDVTILNSNFKLKDDKRTFQEVNGQMKFTKRDLRVNRFSLLVDESHTHILGLPNNKFLLFYYIKKNKEREHDVHHSILQY